MRVILFVQNGAARLERFETHPARAGRIIHQIASRWVSIRAWRAWENAEAWWLVECTDSRHGRQVLGSYRYWPMRPALPYTTVGGRVLAAGR